MPVPPDRQLALPIIQLADTLSAAPVRNGRNGVAEARVGASGSREAKNGSSEAPEPKNGMFDVSDAIAADSRQRATSS